MPAMLQSLTRHWKSSTAIFLLIFGGAISHGILASKTYRSESKLFVRLGRENVTLDSTVTLGGNSLSAVPLSRENEINSVVEILESRSLLEKVVDSLSPAAILQTEGADSSSAAGDQSTTTNLKETIKGFFGFPPLTPREKAVEQLEKCLKIEPARKSNVIVITYEGNSPQSAQSVVAKLVDLYLDEHAKLNRTSGSQEFFAEQTEKLHLNLTAKEDELRQMKDRTGLSSPSDQKQLLVGRIARLDDELMQSESARVASAVKVKLLRSKLAELPEKHVSAEIAGIGNEGTDRMRDQLYALQVKEKEASARYSDEHPRLQQIREELAEARELLASEEKTRTQISTEPDKLHQQTQLELLAEEPLLASLDERLAKLRGQTFELRAELKTLNENEMQIASQQREVDLLETEYRRYAASLEQSRIDRALEEQRISNISVAQAATLEAKPVGPKVKMNLALGFVAAICGAVGVPQWLDRKRIKVQPLEIARIQNGHARPRKKREFVKPR
jgi:uncharacterized protein involved in exopolysaccharide biosynthesis